MAAFGIDVIVGVSACGGVGGIVPSVVFACSGSTVVVRAVIDSEVERYCAVTSSRIDSGVGRCVGAGMGGIAVPIETVAGSDSLVS